MFAAALLASLLAQAEQAPAPAAPAPLTAAPAPATHAPLTAAPTPAAPAPGATAPAPASPGPAPDAKASTAAPPATPPVVIEPAPLPSRNALSVHLRYAYRVGLDGDVTAPAAGMSLGGQFEHRLRAFASGLELGAAADFFYDRFSKEVIVPSTDPINDPEGTIGDRTLSQTSFTLSPTLAWRTGDTRLFAAVGGGVTFGYFVSPDQFEGSKTAVQALVRGAVGADFAVSKSMFAVLRVDYNRTFPHQTFTTDGMTYTMFGDIFAAGAGLLLRF